MNRSYESFFKRRPFILHSIFFHVQSQYRYLLKLKKNRQPKYIVKGNALGVRWLDAIFHPFYLLLNVFFTESNSIPGLECTALGLWQQQEQIIEPNVYALISNISFNPELL